MAKVTLDDSCSVSKLSYDTTYKAYVRLKAYDPRALAALMSACDNGKRVSDHKHASTLSKYNITDRNGVVHRDMQNIVRVALRRQDDRINWVHDLKDDRFSK